MPRWKSKPSSKWHECTRVRKLLARRRVRASPARGAADQCITSASLPTSLIEYASLSGVASTWLGWCHIRLDLPPELGGWSPAGISQWQRGEGQVLLCVARWATKKTKLCNSPRSACWINRSIEILRARVLSPSRRRFFTHWRCHIGRRR
jgi:hypothetical protein